MTLDRLSRQVNLRMGRVEVAAPSIERITKEYHNALSALPMLSAQGDGMKCFMGIVLPLITATYPIVAIDEPEAFLHPPQANALGRILGDQAKSKKTQVVVATHDKNLLSGILQSEADVSIVRLDRDRGGEAAAHQLDTEQLRKLWADPVLRYSNILDGLFHRLVVLAEADQDCRFYSAALDAFSPSDGSRLPTGEVLFVPAGGKDGFPPLVRALHSVRVPVVATPDLDILNDRAKLQRLVEAFNADWEVFDKDYEVATAPFKAPRDKFLVANVLSTLNVIFSDRGSEKFTARVRDEFLFHLRARDNPWSELKKYGEKAFTKQAGEAAQRLLHELDRLGVVAVRVGELECFAPNLPVSKGARWLPAAIRAGSHTTTASRRHIAAILAAGTAARVGDLPHVLGSSSGGY